MRKTHKFLPHLELIKSPFLMGLFVFLILPACTNQVSEIGRKPVVEVSGLSLNAKEFADLLAKKLSRYDALGAKSPDNVIRAKEEIVQDFVMHSLIENWARKNDVRIEKTELDAEINKIRGGFPDDLSFRRELASSGLSFQQWKDSLERSLLERKVFSKITNEVAEPAAEEISRYYDANKEKFRRAESVYLRQILMKETSDAEQVRDVIKSKPFEALAKEFSVAPEAKNGGLIGWVEKGAVDYFDKAFSVPVGSISSIIQSPFGFHILKVEKKLPAGFRPLEEVKLRIARTLKANKEQALFSAWIDSQLRNSKILRNNDIIQGMTVETRKE